MQANQATAAKRWTAEEVRRLPPTERDRILTAAAERLEEAYRLDSELTDFEAFGEDDLHGTNSSTEAR